MVGFVGFNLVCIYNNDWVLVLIVWFKFDIVLMVVMWYEYDKVNLFVMFVCLKVFGVCCVVMLGLLLFWKDILLWIVFNFWCDDLLYVILLL